MLTTLFTVHVVSQSFLWQHVVFWIMSLCGVVGVYIQWNHSRSFSNLMKKKKPKHLPRKKKTNLQSHFVRWFYVWSTSGRFGIVLFANYKYVQIGSVFAKAKDVAKEMISTHWQPDDVYNAMKQKIIAFAMGEPVSDKEILHPTSEMGNTMTINAMNLLTLLWMWHRHLCILKNAKEDWWRL